MNAIPLLLLLVLFMSCTPHSSLQMPVPRRAESKVIDLKASVVRKAVVQVLSRRKFTLDSGRSNAQYLQTEWLRDGAYRNMVKAEVNSLDKDRTELTVDLILQKKTLWKESWQPVDKIRKDAYDDLMNDVLIESYRILYDGG